jgi:hypothetical protein
VRPQNHDFPLTEETQAGVRYHERRALREPLRGLRQRKIAPKGYEMTEQRKKRAPLKRPKSTLPEEFEKFERAMLEVKKDERQGELFEDDCSRNDEAPHGR